VQTLGGAKLSSIETAGVEIALSAGFRLLLLFLDSHLARVLIVPPAGLRCPRTWSLSPELAGCDPIDGRARFDLTGFPGTTIEAIAETETGITIETALVKVEIRRSPLALTWLFRASPEARFKAAVKDRQTQAYLYRSDAPGFAHYLEREGGEHYYGFGEKSGNANKAGRRLRMRTADALGYDAETTDPLYKHIPFYLTVRPDPGGEALGLFYDNLAHAEFDLGQEIDAYHGPYRSFEAAGGDLDLYLIFGPAVREVVRRYTALTGRTAFPPRWSLSYSGSAMQYTEAAGAPQQLGGFLDALKEHDIPCGSFHLSSGYTMAQGKRYVLTWDKSRFPDPAALARGFADAGLKLIANVKPTMLADHPRFAEVEAFRGFVRDGKDDARPHMTQFWGGEAAYLDFTDPAASDWWGRELKAQLLDFGVAATWNDNNEYEIWDDSARVSLNGRGGTMESLRPVQTGLMLRASSLAQAGHSPSKRPFLVTRSGGPGLQRYAQTWTGDNATDWKTLRYNLRMGHGLSLSGIFNFGHDAGGFAGPKPESELFLRWIEQAIYWPRLSIHSWKEDGSANEPWMYPQILGQVREALNWRERLVPLLYTLLWRAHAYHEPVLRPLFYDFPGQAGSYEEQDTFMLGPDLLVAPVVERGAINRSAWLPESAGGWYRIGSGEHFPSGKASIPAPLGAAPAFIRAGSILPLGPSPSLTEGPLTLRFFPLQAAPAQLELFDDDGESSFASRSEAPCLLRIEAGWSSKFPVGPAVRITRCGPHIPRWPEIRFENAEGAPFFVRVDGYRKNAPVDRVRIDELTWKQG
jgi:alpha-glucosidase